MPKFTLESIKAIEGKQKFYDLKINNMGQFETFSSELEAIYKSELLTLYARMDFVSNLNILPKEKFRDITPKKEAVKEYEFKTKHLRVYIIHLEKTGKIIILGGYKNTQKSDVKKFRRLKNEFIKSLNYG